MMRAHRKAHRLVWPLIAIVIGALFIAAIALRPAKADIVSPGALATEAAS
jgi:hypothetical protein